MAHSALYVEDAKISFQLMASSLTKDDLNCLLKWIGSQYGYGREVLPFSPLSTGVDYGVEFMSSIADELRKRLPLHGTTESEAILSPIGLEKSEVHVDSFLYDDDTIDDLVEEGKLPRYYCENCGSRATKPLEFISHSMSMHQMQFLFKNVKEIIPGHEQNIFVDVGSRLGAVLYGAHVWTPFRYIIGIEINPDFCKLQEDVARKFCMDQRVAVICSDVRDQSDLLQRADVIVLHNVFQYFLPAEEQTQIWLFLRNSIRKSGSLLVTAPSLEESVSFNPELMEQMDLTSWVEPVTLDYGTRGDLNESLREEVQALYFYKVL